MKDEDLYRLHAATEQLKHAWRMLMQEVHTSTSRISSQLKSYGDGGMIQATKGASADVSGFVREDLVLSALQRMHRVGKEIAAIPVSLKEASDKWDRAWHDYQEVVMSVFPSLLAARPKPKLEE